MNREDRIKLAIEKGITCDPVTGKVFGVRGKELLSKSKEGYMVICIKKDKKLYHLAAHQFVYYCAHKKIVKQIDHINGLRDDNRIENLRVVTHQQNQQNKTKAKGCSYDNDRNKWRATIKVNKKQIYLGRFSTEQEAHQTYLDAKKIYHII